MQNQGEGRGAQIKKGLPLQLSMSFEANLIDGGLPRIYRIIGKALILLPKRN